MNVVGPQRGVVSIRLLVLLDMISDCLARIFRITEENISVVLE